MVSFSFSFFFSSFIFWLCSFSKTFYDYAFPLCEFVIRIVRHCLIQYNIGQNGIWESRQLLPCSFRTKSEEQYAISNWNALPQTNEHSYFGALLTRGSVGVLKFQETIAGLWKHEKRSHKMSRIDEHRVGWYLMRFLSLFLRNCFRYYIRNHKFDWIRQKYHAVEHAWINVGLVARSYGIAVSSSETETVLNSTYSTE